MSQFHIFLLSTTKDQYFNNFHCNWSSSWGFGEHKCLYLLSPSPIKKNPACTDLVTLWRQLDPQNSCLYIMAETLYKTNLDGKMHAPTVSCFHSNLTIWDSRCIPQLLGYIPCNLFSVQLSLLYLHQISALQYVSMNTVWRSHVAVVVV